MKYYKMNEMKTIQYYCLGVDEMQIAESYQ